MVCRIPRQLEPEETLLQFDYNGELWHIASVRGGEDQESSDIRLALGDANEDGTCLDQTAEVTCSLGTRAGADADSNRDYLDLDCSDNVGRGLLFISPGEGDAAPTEMEMDTGESACVLSPWRWHKCQIDSFEPLVECEAILRSPVRGIWVVDEVMPDESIRSSVIEFHADATVSVLASPSDDPRYAEENIDPATSVGLVSPFTNNDCTDVDCLPFTCQIDGGLWQMDDEQVNVETQCSDGVIRTLTFPAEEIDAPTELKLNGAVAFRPGGEWSWDRCVGENVAACDEILISNQEDL